MDVLLDNLLILNEDNYNYSIKNVSNLIIFEMFGLNFCDEPFMRNQYQQIAQELQNKQTLWSTSNNSTNLFKNSYTLNLMIRLHDFQRVIHETCQNTAQLKTNSLVKFDASSKLRQLQVKREQKLQRINLYKQNLNHLADSIQSLSCEVEALRESNNFYSEKLNHLKSKFQIEKKNYASIEKHNQLLLNELVYFQNKLKKRQIDLMNDLSTIFLIENNTSASTNEVAKYRSNRNSKILNVNLKLTNFTTLTEDQANSIALGYITQSIQLISDILSIPLRYPLVFRSSKSFIIEMNDSSSNNDINNQREFPLFKQNNAQDDLFPYAISLLNKNLSQLRLVFDNYRNVDPNETLINLKWLFDYFRK
jgi:hypothetical protein